MIPSPKKDVTLGITVVLLDKVAAKPARLMRWCVRPAAKGHRIRQMKSKDREGSTEDQGEPRSGVGGE